MKYASICTSSHRAISRRWGFRSWQAATSRFRIATALRASRSSTRPLARILPGPGEPIGRRILYETPDSPVEIVGMTADARLATLRESAPPTLYLPYRQYSQRRMTFAVRVAGDPMAIAAPIRRAIGEIDPDVPLLEIRSQEAQIDAAVRQERVFAIRGFGIRCARADPGVPRHLWHADPFSGTARARDRPSHGARRGSTRGRLHGAPRVARSCRDRRGVRSRCGRGDDAIHSRHAVRSNAA